MKTSVSRHTRVTVPGVLLYFGGLITIVVPAFRARRRLSTGTEPVASLGFGMTLAFVPALVVGNCLITAHASYAWIFMSRHLAATKPARNSFGRPGVAASGFSRPDRAFEEDTGVVGPPEHSIAVADLPARPAAGSP